MAGIKKFTGKGVKFTSFINPVLKDMDKAELAGRRRASSLVKRAMVKKLKESADNWGKREIARRRFRKTGNREIVQGPPGTFKGNLLKGTDKVDGKRKSYVGAMAPAYHAYLLEFGTEHMPAYPYIFTTFAEKAAAAEKAMSKKWIL